MFEVHIIFGGLGKTQASTFGDGMENKPCLHCREWHALYLEHVYLIEGWRIAPPNIRLSLQIGYWQSM